MMYDNPLKELKISLDVFIAEKRHMGYRYINEERLLLQFFKFVTQNQLVPFATEETIMQWVDDSKSISCRNDRIAVIRQFAFFLIRSGVQAYTVPTAYRSIQRKDFCPHIYREKEVAILFRKADMLGKIGTIPCSEKSFPLITRMLYGCGLRISEALSLQVNHVDLRNGVLTIKDTKFFKDRLVPMHDNLTKRCVEYARVAHFLSSPNDFFFPSGKVARITNNTFYLYFRRLLCISGIRKEGRGRGPRVHDMRHTFAVHCLKQLDHSGMDMNAVLPILATYMGHTSYVGTGTYLHLTAELYPAIIALVEDSFETLIPLESVTE